MNKRILFIDDDANILASFRRNLRLLFDIETAESPEEGLALMERNRKTPFAVVVSDFKMPGMDGVECLAQAKRISKDTVRVLLTGYAEVDTAISAVNEGSIFRFLTKPVQTEDLASALDDCVRHHQLIMAERELLRGTLQGSLRVLSDILSLTNPLAFGKGERMGRVVRYLMKHVPVKNGWQLIVAAMLSQLGCVAVPEDVLGKVARSEKLDQEENRQFFGHPAIGADLIRNIPRMSDVAEIIENHLKPLDEISEYGEEVRYLRLASDYDRLRQSETEKDTIIKALTKHTAQYGEAPVEALISYINASSDYDVKSLKLRELREGMFVHEDIYTSDKVLLLTKGQVLTAASIARLLNYGRSCGIEEPVLVRIRHGTQVG